MSVPEEETQEFGVKAAGGAGLRLRCVCVCVFITSEGESQNKGKQIWSYEERR